MKLSIVIPAYNEEHRLMPTLERYAGFMEQRYGPDVELIVAVNGSRDRTAEVARKGARRFSSVRVLVDERPIGKGGAIMMGFREARGELIAFVDADGSTSPEAFDDLVTHLGEADVIIASRWIPGAVIEPRQPLARRVASRIFNTLVRLLFRVKIWDTQCGAKLLRREVVERVMPHLGLTRWAFDVDLLFQARRAGFRIVERPTVWRDAAGSRLNVGRASCEMFVAIVRLRLLYSPFRWIVTLYDRTVARVVGPRA